MNYLIYGTSYKLIDFEIKKIIGNEQYKIFSLNDTPIKEILEDLNYGSLFEEKKVIIIKNAEIIFDSKKEEIEEFIEYLKSPNGLVTLILISSVKPNEKNKQCKDILTYINVIETLIISKPYELSKFLDSFIRKEGYAISKNALDLFSDKCISNCDIALMEFEKLKLIKKDNRLISEQDVTEYVSNYNTNDVFAFKDAVINKNIKKADSILYDIEGTKMEVVPLVIMLLKEYESLYNILALSLKKMSNDDIGKKLDNMHPYRVKILKEAALKYKLADLEHLILYLSNLNLKMITEDNLGYDELRMFLLEL